MNYFNRKTKIVTISGQAQHGKDFTANILKEYLEQERNASVLIIHYADYLKYLCTKLYNWDGKKDEKGRHILQYIGTEKARTNRPNIWVNVVHETLLAIGDDYDTVIIPDCRFPNEIERMREYKWEVIAIKINRLNFENTLTEEQRNHPSEVSLNNFNFDVYLDFETGEDNVIKAIEGSGLLEQV